MWRASFKTVVAAVVLAVVLPTTTGIVHADPAGAPAADRSAAGKISTGRTTTCLVANSHVYCWGNGGGGRIGSPTDTAVSSPRLVAGAPEDVTAVAVGQDHACVLRTTGAVFCFGQNTYYQLGTTSGVTANTLASPTDFTQISAGDNFTCGLSASQGVMCWGRNAGGVLGVPSTSPTSSDIPLQVSMGGDTVEAIDAGGSHVCALLTSTKVKCWGDNAAGELGDGYGNNMNNSLGISGLVPHYVQSTGTSGSDLTDVVAVSAGTGHTCAVLSNGTGRCWGGGAYGQLANGVATGVRTNPTAVRTEAGTPVELTDVKGVFAGDTNTCFVRTSGTVACAGANTYGQIGDGSAGASYAYGPVNVVSTQPGMTSVVAASVGTDFSCALTSSGRAYCWGIGSNGQIGNGSTSSATTTPTAINGAVAQSISVTVPTAKTLGSAPFSVSGSSTSGATVTFTSRTTSICTVSALTVTIVNVGTCTVRASAGPTGVYLAASDVDSNITVAPDLPVAVTGVATSMLTTSATLSASVNARGASTTVSFQYGTSATLVSGAVSVDATGVSGVSDATSSVAVTGLAPGTTYYFRVTATNSVGTTVGSIASFGTSGAKPTVTSGAATPTAFGASIAGEVNANDVETTVSFEYGTDASLATSQTATVDKTVTGATASAVSATLSKLSPATAYYFRVVGSNSVGTSRGDIKSFTTKGAKPTAISGSATPTATRVTLNGKANPGDLETTITFEYGTDAKLVGSTSTAAQVKSGSEDIDVSAVITNLEERTTYYYRIVATNLVGTAKGDIKSFSTTRPEGVSINNGDEFTSSQSVTVSVVGPSTAVKAILSNDGGFATSETFDLVNNAADIPWTLQSSKEGTFTKIVYVKYVSRFGSTSTPYTDDIILDTTKPVVSAATAAASTSSGDAVQVARVSLKASAKGGVKLSVRGSDTISGVGSVEVRSSAAKAATKITLKSIAGKADGKARPMSQTISLKSTAKRLQVRVLDRAGNASAWRSIIVK